MVFFVQTVHLSCVKISSISKWTETLFHLSLVTLEYHQVHPKGFISVWLVWHKLWTYLALTLTLFPKVPKLDFTRPMLPRSSIECIQNGFLAYGTLGANRAPF
jgi:hypothetical protein